MSDQKEHINMSDQASDNSGGTVLKSNLTVPLQQSDANKTVELSRGKLLNYSEDRGTKVPKSPTSPMSALDS